MSHIVKETEKQLKEMIDRAVADAVADGELPQGELPPYVIEVPADRSYGDLAVNAAMVSAKVMHCPPRQIAQTIVAHLALEKTYFEKAEVAGPGFINFFLSPLITVMLWRKCNG